jgi:hypothetical protein
MSSPTISAQTMRGQIPQSIGRVLGRLDRQLRAASFVRGMGTLAIVVSVATVMGMAADFLWELPQAARWAIWGGAVAAMATTFAVSVLRSALRPRTAFDLAAAAEKCHPAMEERLTGAVALLDGGSLAHGSPGLIAAAVDRAAEQVGCVEPSRVIPWRRAWARLAIGLVALGAVCAPLLAWPETYGKLARHFFMPWADVERPARHVLAVSPGDKAVPVGSNLLITASVRSRLPIDQLPAEAWLHWSGEGETAIHRVPMPVMSSNDSAKTPASTSRAREFAVTLPRLARSLFYRVESGSIKSPQYEITVVEPPSVAAITARVEPPAYTKRPATTIADGSRIEVFEGSRVTLDIKASRPVRSIEIEWPSGTADTSEGEKRTASLAENGQNGSVTVVATRSGPFTVALSDSVGIASRPDQPRRVIVRADAPPVVAVQGPDGVSDVSPSDTLRVGIAARDDLAVASVELHYDVVRGDSAGDGGETKHVAVSMKGLGSQSARGEASLALLPLGLKSGDSLSYRVRVADNRPAPRGPNVVWSTSQTLTIVAAAEPLTVRASRARSAGLRGKLDALRKDIIAERGTTDQLRQAAEAVVREDGDWDETQRRSLEEREAAARKIEDGLKRLAREMEAGPGLRELARAAHQVADVEAEAARAALDQTRRENDALARQAGLERSAGRLAAVHERLDTLVRRFDAISQEGAKINRLSELAKRQESLADMARAITGDRAQSDRVQAEQQAIRNELDALLKRTPALLSLAQGGQVKEAERLAKKARALADRQREESQRSGDLSKRGAELKDLAQQQRDLEDDARKLAVQVDQPLAENGRGRLNTEGIGKAALPIERGDVDVARERLDWAEHELRRLALDLEDVPNDPKAVAGRLTRQQAALDREIDAALRSSAGKQLTPEEKTVFARRMTRLGEREQAIAQVTGTIQPPTVKEGKQRFPHDAARDAAAATKRAAQALASGNAKDIENGKDQARGALQRLSDALPNFWQRQEPTKQKFEEARRTANEVADEVTRQLRETNPRPDRLATTSGAAVELAERLTGTADKQARAVAALEAMEPEPRVLPQRDRAVHHAKALAAILRDLREPAKRERAREKLKGELDEAQITMHRLGQKLAGRAPDDDLAQELADDQRAMLEAAGSKKPEPDAATRAQLAALEHDIAGALRNLAVPDAGVAQDEAIRLAERAAGALAEAGPKPGDPGVMREAANAAQALADRLAGRKSPGPQPKAPVPVPVAVSQLPEMGLEPALKPELAATARDLVRRERQIRERLQAMLGDTAAPAREIRSESAALGRELAEFRDRARPISVHSEGTAEAAANHFRIHAPEALDQGIAHLGQGQARAAREDQRRAGALLERGAQLAADLAAALRSEQSETQPLVTPDQAEPGSRENAGQTIGSARDQMRRAAKELDQARDAARASQSVPAAQQAMHQAARDLQAAALQADALAGLGSSGFSDGADPESPADGEGPSSARIAGDSDSALNPESGPGGKAEPDLAKLKEMVRQKTGRKWGELPGHLRDEILQMHGGRYREDYARVIQLYFREIAGAGTTESEGKNK